MLTIKVKADFSHVKAFMTGAHRQIPFALASALTATAKDAQAAEEQEIKRVFEQPVPYTQKGVGITPARKDRLQSEVFLKRKQSAYLEAQIAGGPRRRRPFEAQFGKDISEAIKASVPGQGATLDASGNIRRQTIARIGRLAKSRRGNVFAAPPGGKLQPGIYERSGRGIKPLLIFSTSPAQYRKRFDFYGVGQRIARDRFQINFERAFERALATAR